MVEVMNDRYQEARAAAVREMERIELLDRQGLEALLLERLNAQLAYAYTHSPFYRARRGAAGPPRLERLEALARLPFTTKEDLRDGYPFGFLAVPREALIRYGESTGTTGRPTSSFITFEDWIRGNVWVERAFRLHFGPGDMAFIAIPYELTFASYDIDRAFEQVGASVVAVGTLNQICPFPRLVEMMRDIHPTCLVCTPSRALRLFDMLRERGSDPLQVGLRKLLYVGETASASKLRKLAALWRVELVSAYGSTETNSLALPCAEGRSHLVEGRYHFEVIDPETRESLPPGQLGELVLTSLGTKAMPLIRYRTGDLVRIEVEPCRCASPRRVLRHQGRVGEALVVEGRTLPKLHLEETLLATPGTGTYYVAGVRGGELHVRVETEAAPGDVCREAARRILEAHGVRAAVAPVAREAITRAMDRMLKPGSLELDDLEGLP